MSGRGFYRGRGGRGNFYAQNRGGGGRGGHPAGLKGKEIGMFYAQKNRGRGGHPAGLKGRDIGMFYAQKVMGRRQQQDKQERPLIRLPEAFAQRLEKLEDELGAQNKDKCQLSAYFADGMEDGENFEPDRKMNGNYTYDKQEDHSWLKASTVGGSDFNKRMKEQLRQKQSEPGFIKMQHSRARLPVYIQRHTIMKKIETNQVSIIAGATGSGKSTQIPQFILEHCIISGRASDTFIVVAGPRRISAIALAERVAVERNESLGTSVGYQIRHEARRCRDRAGILYVTNGILLRWMLSDPSLSRVSHIILDEVHERDLFSDFLMIIAKDLLPQRPDLKLVLMSATINAELFADYFSVPRSQLLEVPGRLFPVSTHFLEDVLELTKYKPPVQNRPAYYGRRGQRNAAEEEAKAQFLNQISRRPEYSRSTLDTLHSWDESKVDRGLIISLVVAICSRSSPDAGILVFLPGWTDIKGAIQEVEKHPRFGNKNLFMLVPLHSMLPTLDQRKVFSTPAEGCRKIVFSTSIAETSITVEDIVFVIDSGKTKMSNYDVENDVATLQPEWNSLSNCEQRRGRAGRVREGHCFYLFTSCRHQMMQQFHPPEMLRIRLENLCLQVKLMKLGLVANFLSKAPNPPGADALQKSLDVLLAIGALEPQTEELTSLGWHLARLPVDPHCGKMIIYATLFSCLDPVLTVAACLDSRDMFNTPMGREKEVDVAKAELGGDYCSDHLLWAKVMSVYDDLTNRQGRRAADDWAYEYFVNTRNMEHIRNSKRQLAELLVRAGFLSTSNYEIADANRHSHMKEVVNAVICAGLYPKVAQSKPQNPNARHAVKLETKQWKKLEIHPMSVNASLTNVPTRYVCFHKAIKSTKLYLHDTSMVNPLSLILFSGDLRFQNDADGPVLTLDGWIRFYADGRTTLLLNGVRKCLADLLLRRVTRVRQIDWSERSPEVLLLTCLSELLAEEKLNFRS